MARQVGHLFITGTIHDVTYYKMFGTYYARMKSSLSRKTVLTSPRFARTRMHSNQLAEASQIASKLYENVPKENRSMPFFRSIVGKAKLLLAQGKDKEVVLDLLRNELFPEVIVIAPKQIIQRKPKEKIYVNKKGKLVWKISRPEPSFRSNNLSTLGLSSLNEKTITLYSPALSNEHSPGAKLQSESWRQDSETRFEPYRDLCSELKNQY